MSDGNATTAGRLPAQNGVPSRGGASSRARGAGRASVDAPELSEPAVPETPPEPVGPRLREAREAAGLTLEQVSARTRIRVPVLRELEDDRLGTAGTAVYTRGHLRAIASAVGIDPVPLVRALDERVGASAPAALVAPPVPVPAPRTAGLNVPTSAPPERSQPRWLTASLAVLAVFVVLLAVGVFGEDGAERTDALVPRAGTVPEVAPSAEPTPSAAPSPAGAVLVLRSSGPSWLSVRNRGGYPVFEGTVAAGWTQRFADPRQLTVRVGNAGAVTGSCAGAPNGALAGDPGAQGTAVTLRCTPQGWQQP